MKSALKTTVFILVLISLSYSTRIKKTKKQQALDENVNDHVDALLRIVSAVDQIFLRKNSETNELYSIIEFIKMVEEAADANDADQFESLSNEYFKYSNIHVNTDGSISASELNYAGCDHARKLLINNKDFPFNAKNFANEVGIIEKRNVVKAFTALMKEFDELLDSLDYISRKHLEDLFHIKFEVTDICSLKNNDEIIASVSNSVFESDDKDSNGEVDVNEFANTIKHIWELARFSNLVDEKGDKLDFENFAKKEFLKYSLPRNDGTNDRYLGKQQNQEIIREFVDFSCIQLWNLLNKILSLVYQDPACQSSDY